MPPTNQKETSRKGAEKKRQYTEIANKEEPVTNSNTSSHDSEDEYVDAKTGKMKPNKRK
jgi:hypothetical protein